MNDIIGEKKGCPILSSLTIANGQVTYCLGSVCAFNDGLSGHASCIIKKAALKIMEVPNVH